MGAGSSSPSKAPPSPPRPKSSDPRCRRCRRIQNERERPLHCGRCEERRAAARDFIARLGEQAKLIPSSRATSAPQPKHPLTNTTTHKRHRGKDHERDRYDDGIPGIRKVVCGAGSEKQERRNAIALEKELSTDHCVNSPKKKESTQESQTITRTQDVSSNDQPAEEAHGVTNRLQHQALEIRQSKESPETNVDAQDHDAVLTDDLETPGPGPSGIEPEIMTADDLSTPQIPDNIASQVGAHKNSDEETICLAARSSKSVASRDGDIEDVPEMAVADLAGGNGTQAVLEYSPKDLHRLLQNYPTLYPQETIFCRPDGKPASEIPIHQFFKRRSQIPALVTLEVGTWQNHRELQSLYAHKPGVYQFEQEEELEIWRIKSDRVCLRRACHGSYAENEHNYMACTDCYNKNRICFMRPYPEFPKIVMLPCPAPKQGAEPRDLGYWVRNPERFIEDLHEEARSKRISLSQPHQVGAV